MESRPGVQLVFLMRMAAGSGLVVHPTRLVVMAAFGWAMLTIAVYVYNGISDVTCDVANHSARPLASGAMDVRTAQVGTVLLAGAGISMCWLVGPTEAALGIGLLVLGWAYSSGPSLKNNVAGFAVVIGLGAALTYVAGWVARGHVTSGALVLAGSISVWVAVCCASKDFSDIDGDRLAGRRTWPVIWGPAAAARLLSVAAVCVGGGVLLGAQMSGASVVPAAAVMTGSVVISIAALRSASAGARPIRRRPYKAFMVTQYAANIAVIACMST